MNPTIARGKARSAARQAVIAINETIPKRKRKHSKKDKVGESFKKSRLEATTPALSAQGSEISFTSKEVRPIMVIVSDVRVVAGNWEENPTYILFL